MRNLIEGNKIAAKNSRIIYDQSQCILCGTCTGVCSESAIKLYGSYLSFDNTKCISCGLCVSSCPLGAINQANINISYRRENAYTEI